MCYEGGGVYHRLATLPMVRNPGFLPHFRPIHYVRKGEIYTMSLSQGNKEYWISELHILFDNNINQNLKERGTSLADLRDANIDRVTLEIGAGTIDAEIVILNTKKAAMEANVKRLEDDIFETKRKRAALVLDVPLSSVTRSSYGHGDNSPVQGDSKRAEMAKDSFRSYLENNGYEDILALQERRDNITRAIMLHTSGPALREFLEPILSEFNINLNEVMNPTQSPASLD